MKPLPIVVGGFYRSGTSLVRRLLDSHSHIHCPPEIKFLKDFRGDYQDDPLAHGRFFASVRSIGLSEGQLLETFGAAFIRAHEIAAVQAGKQRWADKSPENALYLADWQQLLPDGFQFIYVERNPLDALSSLKEIGFAKTVPTGFAEKVELYAKFQDEAQAYVARHPASSFLLRYERLVTTPRQAMSDLFSFLGEPDEEAVLTKYFAEERGIGLEDPKVTATRSVHSASIDRWRNDLTKDEIAQATARLRPIAGTW